LIIIEEDGLRRLGARRVETVLARHFLIDRYAVLYSLADEELVAELHGIVVFPRMTYIDIQQTVSIDVGNADSRTPCTVAGQMRLFRRVFETEIPLVKEQFIGTGVAGKKDIVQSVAIQIGDADARTVVEVFVAEHVERIVLPDIIRERYPGLFFVEEGE